MMTKFAAQRKRMVREQIIKRGVKDQRVLDAMSNVPRHEFVPLLNRGRAYEDRPLPIGNRQTISQPYVVSHMTELLCLQGHETVLEIGTGSGYQAAILAEVAAQVITIERHAALAKKAGETLARLGYDNVQIIHTDGSGGWPPAAPYAGILIAASAPEVADALLDQLAIGGRLVLPVGPRASQFLQCWQRLEEGYKSQMIAPVSFVPLLGEHGWDEKEWGK